MPDQRTQENRTVRSPNQGVDRNLLGEQARELKGVDGAVKFIGDGVTAPRGNESARFPCKRHGASLSSALYCTSISSTSKISVAFAGMAPG